MEGYTESRLLQQTQPMPMVCHIVKRNRPFGVFSSDPSVRYGFSLVLLDLVLVLLIIRVLRYILKPLRQPRIVSELIAGVILGPFLLRLNPNFHRYILPEPMLYVMGNIGVIGFMFFLFIAGVKMDISAIRRIAGKKHLYIAGFCVIVPLTVSMIVGFTLRQSMQPAMARISSIGSVAASVSMTSFPVIQAVLREFDFFNSEMGRFAMCIAFLSDVVGMISYFTLEAMAQGETKPGSTIWYLISAIMVLLFLVTVVRLAMQWVVSRTPPGEPVDENYVVLIIVGVMMMGFLTDLFGMGIANGPLLMGIVIPDGPPLGATLVERSETIVTEIIMPFSYALIGLQIDVFGGTEEWSALYPLVLMILVGYISKLVATSTAAYFFKTPVKESIALGLMTNLRGQVEVLLFHHWIERRMIGISGYTALVLLTIINTSISTPLTTLIYDTSRPFMVNKQRTIQHTPPGNELRVVLSIPDQETIGSLISLLDHLCPTPSNPFAIFALHLVGIEGRSAPIFLESKEGEHKQFNSKFPGHDTIRKSLNLFHETRAECVRIRNFTAVAPKSSMYRDICQLALIEEASLIILPFHKKRLDDVLGVESCEQALRSINGDVLAHAPCSVALLFDKDGFCSKFIHTRDFDNIYDYRKAQHFVLLFLGGADCREALYFADRLIQNPFIHLTIFRFLPNSVRKEEDLEKKLDDGVVTWFWVKNEANQRVIYREMVVNNGFETLSAIYAMSENGYDLWITGRKQGIHPMLIEGLSTWSEDDELGLIGENVAAIDTCMNSSILVIQQQILRGQEKEKPVI